MNPLDPIVEEIQSAVRRAHVLRTRGDVSGAETEISRMLDKFPEHPDAIEAKADFLVEQGKIKEARDLLAPVVEKHPGRISTERKYAELVLQVGAREMLFVETPDRLGYGVGKRSANTAGFLSLLLPGFGQVYNAELYKGIVFSVLAVSLWIGLFTIGLGPKSQPSGFFWPILVCLLTVYVASILDAAVTAGKLPTFEPPTRPVPPVDKPFE